MPLRPSHPLLLPRFAMARAYIVLDENLYNLKPGLEANKFDVRMVKSGEDDEEDIIPNMKENEILVTNNPKDFREAALREGFSVIDTTRTLKDAYHLVRQISKIMGDQKLGIRAKMPFFLILQRDGKYELKSIADIPLKEKHKPKIPKVKPVTPPSDPSGPEPTGQPEAIEPDKPKQSHWLLQLKAAANKSIHGGADKADFVYSGRGMAHPLLTARPKPVSRSKKAETVTPAPNSTVEQTQAKPRPGTKEWAMKCVELAKLTPQPPTRGEPHFEAWLDMLQLGE